MENQAKSPEELTREAQDAAFAKQEAKAQKDAEKAAAKQVKDAEKAAEKEAKAAKMAAEKAARPAKQEQNGVTRPQSGSTARVWAIADEISAKKQAPATRKEVSEQGLAENLIVGTINTQFGKWRKFFGLGAEPKEVKAAAVTAE